MHRIYAILYKEFKQMRRDTTMLRLLILLPIIQILIFGLAINTEVKHIPTVVLINVGNKKVESSLMY